ncbi:hypothetical protein EDD85DRAFT_962683 [Armillaria nabsnona]|nr:hypothetical protein EDD85DRAFT_962683 [Armillaria nabsnona]
MEGNSPFQMIDNPESFSVLTVSSDYISAPQNASMLVTQLQFFRTYTQWWRQCHSCQLTISGNQLTLREDVRGFGYESEGDGHGTIPSCNRAQSIALTLDLDLDFAKTSSGEHWGADTKHVWACKFWYCMLRSKELIKVVYDTMFPLDEAATDKDKYKMELGEGLVHIFAWRLSGHTMNPIMQLPYNAPTEDADHNDSLFLYPNFHKVHLVPFKKDIAFVKYLDEESSGVAKDALHNYKLDGENQIKITLTQK